MSVVLDTTVLIDILRGYSPAQQFYQSLTTIPLCSEVTRVEILGGMRSHERSATQRLLASLDWYPVDTRVSEQAGKWGREYRRSHAAINLADFCVAATAQVLTLPLLTSNVKHFPMFSDLRPPY